ncbi:MAG TPA: glycosyltransferase family A protein [Gemmatimonadaceae bacterium]|nr:glycosyltransferase family A protein [Gemmatimonadaceae bacterium]
MRARRGRDCPGRSVASCSPAARKPGMHTASGEAIALQDSDDYWEPNHLETVVPLLGHFPDAAVAA